MCLYTDKNQMHSKKQYSFHILVIANFNYANSVKHNIRTTLLDYIGIYWVLQACFNVL